MNERPKEHGNIEIYRERFLAQDKRLLEAAGILAARIKALPTDPKHPNWEPRALIVGGFVRDAILGLAPKDADIEVYGVSPDRLESILDQHFPHQVNKVGKAFGILKVNLGNGLDFDVSLPRRESKSGKGHTGFTTKSDPGMNIKEAARRRDFTMNALAADPLTGEIIDEFGGIQDLENGILRVTDAKRFQDDALRVYRGIQFCGRMNLTADPESKKLMQEMVKRGETDPKNELAIPVQTAKEICQLLNPDLPPRHIEKELEQLIEKEFSDLAAKHEISKDAFRKFIHDFDFPASPDQILKAVSQFEANPEEIISLTSRFVSNRDTRLIDVLSEQLDPRLSSERISEEIRKLLLKGKKPSVGFELMRELGMIDRHYPELRALVGTEQEPAWHKEGDVWNHTMRVIDSAAKLIRKTNFTLTEEEKLEVMIGALCHDLGKPLTTNKSTKNGVERITSAGHDRAGKEPAKSLCSRWPTLGIDVIHAAEVLTTEHMQIGSLFRAREDGHLTDVPYANAVRKLLKRIHPLPWRVLLLVSESDHLGSDSGQKKSDTYEAGAFFEETIERKKLDQDPTKPLIQGRDLLELGFSPGPKVGFYIKRIEAARDQGQIENRAEALELLRNILGEEGS